MKKKQQACQSQLTLPGVEAPNERHLVSASRRTDIPAYYTPWFLQRVQEGFCEVPNPFNPYRRLRVSLQPQDVVGIVFWTRDPRPLVPHLAWLRHRDIDFHMMITMTGYPRWYEPGGPPVEAVAVAAREIAREHGPERVSWRYDPILFSSICTPAVHVRQVLRTARLLEGAARRIIVSPMESYVKTQQRLAPLLGTPWEVCPPTATLLEATMPGMLDAARRHGMSLQSCAQPEAGEGALRGAGVPGGACLDAAYFRNALGWDVAAGQGQGQRNHCTCASSLDIGMYESCPRGCVYCYAVTRFERSRANFRRHDPTSSSLL